MTTTLKLLNAKNEIATYSIKQGEQFTLNAQPNVNYQLIDENTGFAPQNILTKREGTQLLIFLEDGDVKADIILQNYYDGNMDNMLIGLHENGQIYAYVPESGVVEDAVSVLAEQVSRPQALGGEQLNSVFWAWNPWWVAGAAGLLVGGIALAAANHSSGSSKTEKAPQAPSKENTTSVDAPPAKEPKGEMPIEPVELPPIAQIHYLYPDDIGKKVYNSELSGIFNNLYSKDLYADDKAIERLITNAYPSAVASKIGSYLKNHFQDDPKDTEADELDGIITSMPHIWYVSCL
ncbi:TPA: hypothetical protein ACK3JW_001697 [Mannheimia haemolytica]